MFNWRLLLLVVFGMEVEDVVVVVVDTVAVALLTGFSLLGNRSLVVLKLGAPVVVGGLVDVLGDSVVVVGCRVVVVVGCCVVVGGAVVVTTGASVVVVT